MAKKTYLTQDRYDATARELRELKTSGRKRVADRLKQAKDLGDLSENFDYQTAREEQSNLEQRISQLEDLLRNASIITKAASGGTVKIGSRVSVSRNGTTVTYTITGSSEAQPSTGLISNESPIGRALLGKHVGDEVRVTTPRGETLFQVLAIE